MKKIIIALIAIVMLCMVVACNETKITVTFHDTSETYKDLGFAFDLNSTLSDIFDTLDGKIVSSAETTEPTEPTGTIGTLLPVDTEKSAVTYTIKRGNSSKYKNPEEEDDGTVGNMQNPSYLYLYLGDVEKYYGAKCTMVSSDFLDINGNILKFSIVLNYDSTKSAPVPSSGD